MNIATRTPEGEPNRCPICGKGVILEPSAATRDAPCPHCGCLLWFKSSSAGLICGLPDYTIPSNVAKTKEQAIQAVLCRLVEDRRLPAEEQQNVFEAIMKRESLGSTGIGRGVAIPHAKSPAVKELVIAVGRFPDGVEFNSLDAMPVNVMCVLVSPSDRPGEHLRALGRLSKMLRGQE
jgi:PTS system fructose-specific IIA component/PTS system nitrogen regulatory IIA component